MKAPSSQAPSNPQPQLPPPKSKSRGLPRGIRRHARRTFQWFQKNALGVIAITVVVAVLYSISGNFLEGRSASPLTNFLFSSPGSVAASPASAGWQPIEIGPTPKRFNPNGASVWDIDHPMGCIYVRLAKWAGGTDHGPYCDNGSDPDNNTPQGVEMVWSASGSTFEAMVKVEP